MHRIALRSARLRQQVAALPTAQRTCTAALNASARTSNAGMALAAHSYSTTPASFSPSAATAGATGSRGLSRADILQLPSTPAASPSYPRGPYTFYDREYFIIVYESCPTAIRKRVPEPLVPAPGNLVLYEWISMPDSTGFGSYTESGVVIPCLLNGEEVNFTQSMFLDCEPPIAAGREIWGFPKKYARPVYSVKNDTIFGTLKYANQDVASGTMVYKHSQIAEDEALKSLTKTSVNLKIIPDVDYKPKVAQLVGYNLTNIKLKGAWTGPARLQLTPHVNAPVSDFPVKRVITGKHFLADITLPYGRVLHDYIKERQEGQAKELTRETSIDHNLNQADQEAVSKANEATRTHHGYLTRQKVLNTVCMPVAAPSYSMNTHNSPSQRVIKHKEREYFIVSYRSDPEAIRACLPDLLYPNKDNTVLLMWVHTTGGGVGDYSKLDVLIPCHDKHGNTYHWGAQSYVDSSASITLGREVFGMPQKFGQPSLKTNGDTLHGNLNYAELPVAAGTMSFKTKPCQFDEATELIQVPHLGLKLIPDVDGRAAVAQLVRSDRTHINIRSAFKGAARLDLRAHVNAPVADLPVHHVNDAYHLHVDLDQPIGVVLHDYLTQKDSKLV